MRKKVERERREREREEGEVSEDLGDSWEGRERLKLKNRGEHLM